jgi:DNA-binding NarL/FixJ family response regulator
MKLGSPITVLIADDSQSICNAIHLVLASEPTIKIVGEATSYPKLSEMASELRPQAVLTDIHMPGDFDPEFIKAPPGGFRSDSDVDL